MESQNIKSPSLLQSSSTSQLFIKDPLALMATKAVTPPQEATGPPRPNVRGSPPPQMLSQLSPLQVIQSQLGLTPQQLQLLVHHQQQQIAFQSVSIRFSIFCKFTRFTYLLKVCILFLNISCNNEIFK